MSATARQMHLAVIANGVGNQMGAWRLPEAEVGSVDIGILNRIAQAAERGKFDMFFLADALSFGPVPASQIHLEVLTAISALAMTTRRIGLAATVSTTYSEPYNLARMLSSIDHISGGRAGWNVVTTARDPAAPNFGRAKHPPPEERYERAAEYMEVVKGLWDSWEDGALLEDKASGRFVDLGKRHDLNHDGKFYSVKGPLNISRMPQGYPVIVQAGASDAGLAFAAAHAEVVFAVQDDIGLAREFRSSLRAKAEAAGRDPDHLKVLVGLSYIIADSEEEGRGIYEKLAGATDPDHAWAQLSVRLGIQLKELPPEGPVPEPAPGQVRGYARPYVAAARRHNFNLRQLRDYAAVTGGYQCPVGSPGMIADHMQEWIEAGAADGFMVRPLWFTGMFDRFVDRVVPVLQERGLFRKDYAGTTLRDHLSLPRPPHPNVGAKERLAV